MVQEILVAKIKCVIFAQIDCPDHLEDFCRESIRNNFVAATPPLTVGQFTLMYDKIIEAEESNA